MTLRTPLGLESESPSWGLALGTSLRLRRETGGDELFLYDLGTKASRRLTDSSGLGFPFNKRPSWSPDSQKITFWSSRTGHDQIWVIDSDGSNLLNLSNNDFNEQNPVWVKP